MEYKILEDNNVSKFIFNKEDMVAEAVLYKYESYKKKTVICCSVQSGCKVGCTFCGTGKRFIRSLTSEEIVEQIKIVINNKVLNEIKNTNEIEKFQIMFMSMGEPFDNYYQVKEAIIELNKLFPNAQLLISTVGLIKYEELNDFMKLSIKINKIGLQFSIHQANEEKRNKLIPYKNKLTLRKIRDYGIEWSENTGRPVYLNYCIDGNNVSENEINRLKDLFSKKHFYFTFSVICSLDKNNKLKGTYNDMNVINQVSQSFLEEGYNTRIFNPAGQDTIGGGCGQLWFVQDWMRNYKINYKRNKIIS